MIEDIFKSISLTLPVLISGLVLILVLKLKLFKTLDFPMDFNKSFLGKRVLGNNKTIRGAFVIVATAIVTTYILNLIYRTGFGDFIDPVFSNNPVFIGIIYSFSYIFGEIINSFVKRRLGIPSGGKAHTNYRYVQAFFDLFDGIIAVITALLLFTSVSVNYLIIAGIIGLFLHLLTDILMIKLRLKNKF